MYKKAHKSSFIRFGMVMVLLVVVLGATPIRHVLASTITVTTISDSGAGSLRQAVANAISGDTILFDPSLAGQTITLASNLVIDKDLTIDGSGLSPQVTVSGGNVAHLEVTGTLNRSVAISNLTIADGYTSENGGAISSIGILTIINSTLKNNHAAGDGGAIFSYDLVLKNTTIYQNQADSDGGALAFAGIAYDISIANSTVSQNQASSRGGAIYMMGNAEAGIYNSTFADNSAPVGSEVMLIGNSLLILYNTAFVCTFGGSSCYVTPATATIDDSHNSILGVGTLSDYGLIELNDNGGPTKTMALLLISPFIDAGNNDICSNAFVNNLDQRGVDRPQGASCDIGAYEYRDTTPPTVKINRADGQVNPTSANSVDFTVTFSEPVTNVDIGDFTLATAGVMEASITSIGSFTNTTYTVTVNTGFGNGTLRLDMPGTAKVIDLAGNLLENLPFTDGEDYIIEKTPIVSSGKYDDRDKAWTYMGNWIEINRRGPYLGTYTYSTEAKSISIDVKDFALLSFKGSKFTLIYTQHLDGGVMYIYVDDFTEPVAVINQNGSLVWQKTWTSNLFTLGVHTVKLVHVSGNVNIDAIQIHNPYIEISTATELNKEQ